MNSFNWTPRLQTALKHSRWLVIASLLVHALFASAACAQATPTSREFRVAPAESLQWTDVRAPDGSKLGIRSTDVWGHATSGAHGSLSYLPAGFKERPHYHSHGIRVVVIKGTMRFTIRGTESPLLQPGSFVYVGAEIPHYAQCVSETECEVLIEQDGAMDVNFVDK